MALDTKMDVSQRKKKVYWNKQLQARTRISETGVQWLPSQKKGPFRHENAVKTKTLCQFLYFSLYVVDEH